jgi:hypothetical protein
MAHKFGTIVLGWCIGRALPDTELEPEPVLPPRDPEQRSLLHGDARREEPSVSIVAMIALFLCGSGTMYAYDLPGAIGVGPRHTLYERFASCGSAYSHVKNQSLYSLYLLPCCGLVFALSLATRRGWKVSTLMVAACIIVCAGSWVFYVGANQTLFRVLALGRFIMGVGEAIPVLQGIVVATMFPESRHIQALAIMFIVTCDRVTGAAMFGTALGIADSIGADGVALVSAIVCTASAGASGVFLFMDRQRMFIGSCTRCKTTIDLAAFKAVSISVPMILLVAPAAMAALTPYFNVARVIVAGDFAESAEAAEAYVAVGLLCAAIAAPLAPYLVRRYGSCVQIIVLLCLVAAVNHAVVAGKATPPVVNLVVVGIVCGALDGLIWFGSTRLTPKPDRPTVVSMCIVLQTISFAITAIVCGSVMDAFMGSGDADKSDDITSAGFTWLEVLFVGISTTAAGLAMVLWYAEHRFDGLLQR